MDLDQLGLSTSGQAAQRHIPEGIGSVASMDWPVGACRICGGRVE